jgi:hypothetical protein
LGVLSVCLVFYIGIRIMKSDYIYIENNILDKGIFYLQETQAIYYQQQEFAKSFISDLK